MPFVPRPPQNRQTDPPTGVDTGDKKPGRLSIGMSTVSPHSYQPDQTRVLDTVLGKGNYAHDPHTGQLVFTRQPDHKS